MNAMIDYFEFVKSVKNHKDYETDKSLLCIDTILDCYTKNNWLCNNKYLRLCKCLGDKYSTFLNNIIYENFPETTKDEFDFIYSDLVELEEIGRESNLKLLSGKDYHVDYVFKVDLELMFKYLCLSSEIKNKYLVFKKELINKISRLDQISDGDIELYDDFLIIYYKKEGIYLENYGNILNILFMSYFNNISMFEFQTILEEEVKHGFFELCGKRTIRINLFDLYNRIYKYNFNGVVIDD